MQWQNATVIGNKQWNERLCSLRIKAQLPAYEAGQFVSVALPESDGKPLARPYSLVNSPADDDYEFYFNRVDDGPLSPRLQQLKVGDGLLVATRAAGFLVLSQVPDAEQLWLLATGTGIGPFLAMLQTRDPWMRFKTVILVHGIRNRSEMAYIDTLSAIKREHPEQFQFQHSITRQITDNTLQQRIPYAITDGSLEDKCNTRFSANKSQVMICGNPAMVADSSAALVKKGLIKNRRRQPGQITVEVYK